jgi:hypothetical protein
MMMDHAASTTNGSRNADGRTAIGAALGVTKSCRVRSSEIAALGGAAGGLGGGGAAALAASGPSSSSSAGGVPPEARQPQLP